MNTPAAFLLRSAMSCAWRLLALAGFSVAVSAPAAVFYWDPNGAAANVGGAGTWDLSSVEFRQGSEQGSLVAWNTVDASQAQVVFTQAAGAVEIKSATTVEANKLTFEVDGYLMQGANNGRNTAVRFVGTAPELRIMPRATLTLGTEVFGSSLLLSGGGTLKLAGDNFLGDSLGLIVAEGSTFGFNNAKDTVGSLELRDGFLGMAQGENGELTASSYLLQSGSITVKLHGSTATSGLRKTGAGTVTLYGKTDYSGDTSIEGGTVALGAADVLSQSSNYSVNGGTLDLRGTNQTTKGLVLVDGTITSTNSSGQITSGILAIANKSTAAPIEVRNGRVDVTIQSHGLLKTGGGTVVLTKTAEMDNGTIVIRDGILDLTQATVNNAQIDVQGGRLVAAGSPFQSSTTISLNGGFISPGGGGAVGTLNTGNEVWNSGGFDFNVWNATGTAGTGWDRLTVNQLALGTGPVTLNVIGLVAAAGGTGLVTNFSNLPGSDGYSWTFVTAQNGISGFDAAKFAVDLTQFQNEWSGGSFSVTQSGNSLNLVFSPVPEPRTYALMLGLVTLGFVAYRRWRVAA